MEKEEPVEILDSEAKNSSDKSSANETAIEDFSWVNDEEFSNSKKRNYLKYPLQKWLNIGYEANYNSFSIQGEGYYYQGTVNKILSEDVFRELNFIKEKDGVIKFNLNSYNIDPSKLIKNSIFPDFFIHKIERDKFMSILRERSYMIKTKYIIPEKAKFISIIGEIKVSYNSVCKNNNQKKDYLTFIKLASC